MTDLLSDLLIGLPGQRPGGLTLSVLTAVTAALVAVVAGLAYASICAAAPVLTLGLQGALALLRGIPLILLIFALAQLTTLPLAGTGFVALTLYSLSHVGETFRSYLTSYPVALREQARLLTVSAPRDLLTLRVPWAFRKSLDTLGTHWISLLKDTGALTVLGIGELTTVARLLSERESMSRWIVVLTLAAALYLATVLLLMRALRIIRSHLARKGV